MKWISLLSRLEVTESTVNDILLSVKIWLTTNATATVACCCYCYTYTLGGWIPRAANWATIFWQRKIWALYPSGFPLNTWMAVWRVKNVEVGPYSFISGCNRYVMLSHIISAKVTTDGSVLESNEGCRVSCISSSFRAAGAFPSITRWDLAMILKAQQYVRLFATVRFRNQRSFTPDGSEGFGVPFIQDNGDGACDHWADSHSWRPSNVSLRPCRRFSIARKSAWSTEPLMISNLSSKLGILLALLRSWCIIGIGCPRYGVVVQTSCERNDVCRLKIEVVS